MGNLLNGPVGIALAILAIIAAVVIVLNQSDSGPVRRFTTGEYYYDMTSNKLFVGPVGAFPPVDSPSGPGTGAKAYVFSCGDCADESSRFVAYIERFPPDVHKVLDNPEATLAEKDKARNEGREIKTVEAEDWLKATSEEGQALMIDSLKRCNGKKVMPCKETSNVADPTK